MIGLELITNSRLRCLRECPRRHYYRYEVGLRPIADAKALRFGSAYHHGLHLLASGQSQEDVCAAVSANYETCPEWADAVDWQVECETVMRLILGWQWRWEDDGIVVHESEKSFRLPIVNPDTGAPTPSFDRSGKLDQLVRLPDGRLAIREFKTTADSVDPNSDYWSILRMDSQVSFYFDAQQNAETILYDVCHKPGIAPKRIPVLDDKGLRVVFDAAGQRVFKKDGSPRESGDKEKGYTMQDAVETPEQFGERLTADIGERPDFYYARKEVPRLTADLEAFRAELWQEQQLLRHRQKKRLWTRHPGRQCSMCDCRTICFNDLYPVGDETPAGFVRIENIHPELETEQNDNSNSTSTAAAGPEPTAVE